MKGSIPILLSLLLLTGCGGGDLTPTPTPTERPAPISTLELDVGDGQHTFWLELTRAGEPGDLTVSVYQKEGDPQPLQTFTEWSPDYQLTELKAEDVNFDGHMDFHFLTNTGTKGTTWSAYYVWDRAQGQFVPDPYSLNELTSAWFMPDRQEVGSRDSWGTTEYQYEDGSLTLVGESYVPQEEDPSESYVTRRITTDPAHTFWVELREDSEGDREEGLPVTLTVYGHEKATALQHFKDLCLVRDVGAIGMSVEDVNFDGYPDLCYSSWAGAHSFGSTCLVWDPEKECFLQDPYGLKKLCLPSFDPEKRVVETWNYSGGDNETEYYRYYRNGEGELELTCVRRLLTRSDLDTFTATLIVEDHVYGELTEVYRAENIPETGVTWPSTREFRRWKDPDYRGGQALPLDVGDGEHTFWIEADLQEGWRNEFERGVTLSIYRQEQDRDPIQVLETATMAPGNLKLEAVDANFDGFMDFYFPSQVGANNGFYSFWLWDEGTGTFVEDHSGLSGLPYPHFEPEEKRIYSHMLGSATSSTDQVHTFRDGELVCLRSVSHDYSLDEKTVHVVVWDERMGTIEDTLPRDSDWYNWLDPDYPVRREVKVDRTHTFWVDVTPREEEPGGIWLNIYRGREDPKPVQQFAERTVSFQTLDLTAEDVDFDGRTDLHFVSSYGSLPLERRTYYIWDAGKGKFIPDPYGLNDLPYSEFDPENQLITAYWHYDAIGGRQEYYRYIDHTLTCVRRLETGGREEDGSRLLQVWDLRKGELVKVWSAIDLEGDQSDTTYQKALSRWEDLNYPARQEVKADQAHTFWAEAVDLGTPVIDGTTAAVYIYQNKEDTTPFQTFEETLCLGTPAVTPVDVDFDGDMDLSVLLHEYRSIQLSAYYIWDRDQECFIPDPYGLNELSRASFDPENKIIVQEGPWSVMGGGTCYYRYEGASLICVRTLSWSFNSEGKMDLLVTDGWDGERKVVYETAAAMDELVEDKVGTEEFLRWYDLDYHGQG